MIGLPPSFVGAVNVTVADASPADALTPVGASGTVDVSGAAGVTAFDGAEGDDSPFTFTAFTVNVYAVPFARPVTATVILPSAAVPALSTVFSSTPFDHAVTL